MKSKPLFLALVSALAVSHAAAAGESRTWTSAEDASKTFEGEFVSLEGDKVTVKKGDKELSFPLSMLSEADVAYIEEAVAEAKKAEKLADAKLTKAIKGKLVRLDGKRLKRYDLLADKTPEYYLVYYSASW